MLLRSASTVALRLLSGAASLALPPRCPACGAVTADDHRFCVDCWDTLRFLGPPWCAGCATPFEHDRGEGAMCGACLVDPPRHSGVRAAVAYGEVARRTVLKLKYGGRIGCANTVARLMLRLLPEDTELLVPVPLHRRRLWSRGFNQSGLIAVALGRDRSVPVALDALVRRRPTPVLKGLDRRARAKAMAGAFTVPPERRETIAGRRVVLIDDVYTSGATTDACTVRLLRAGAASVTIVCWARVLRPADD
ncbi:ComF family protein [Sphingomonas sp. S1-29]|uniref:ComF family protein n=1 Tax=Sphingomonas sp. S1-29 TaxID=2991074 RepID=UPI0022407FB2|nr:ComF family protein [Sphingomonas sp. S1-29]UZK70730.1 ComF family protein [Sphingomonas sp. S1-29]